MLDIVFLIIIGVLILFGYLRGLVRELSEIFGIVIGIFLAMKFSAIVGQMIMPADWSHAIKTPVAAT
ncbi:CvpA family protein, partial [bacterium]|nr:CvpA family protein [bacterium]